MQRLCAQRITSRTHKVTLLQRRRQTLEMYSRGLRYTSSLPHVQVDFSEVLAAPDLNISWFLPSNGQLARIEVLIISP